MRITSRDLTVMTAGLVSAVVLTGCSNNSTKPTVLPTLASTSAAPTTPATTPPVAPSPKTTTSPPAPTKAQTLAAANKAIEKTVRDYYATLDESLTSTKAAAKLDGTFTISCQQCAQDVANVKRIHAKGWQMTGGQYIILSIKPGAVDANSGGATITFRVASDVIRDKNGKVFERDAAEPEQSAGLTVDRTAHRWLIVGYIDFGKTK